MNQNNNYKFDPMTGKPIDQIQTPIQQPVQPIIQQPIQQTVTQTIQQTPIAENNNLNNKPKNNNKIFIIIIAVLLVVIVALVIYFTNKNNDDKQPESNNNQEVQNNNNDNNSQSNNSNNSNNTTNNNQNSNNNVENYTKEELQTSIVYTENDDFLMDIEDVFTISGRGTVVTGRILSGKVKLGDTIEIIGLDHETITTRVTGIEMFRKQLDEAKMGDNVGILLENVERDDVERGQVLAKPGSINAYTKFDAAFYVLSKEEGGRHTSIIDGYRPQMYFRTIDVTGEIKLLNGFTEIEPGNIATATITLISPIAMEEGTTFSIREGGRTVGYGKVIKIYEN